MLPSLRLDSDGVCLPARNADSLFDAPGIGAAFSDRADPR